MDKKLKTVVKIAAVIGAIVGATKYIKSLPPDKYSLEWIKSLSPSDWEKEREIVRQKYCASGSDWKAATNWERILHLFDRVWQDLHTSDKPFTRPPREHGWNLYKD